jgi:hypothetical protein
MQRLACASLIVLWSVFASGCSVMMAARSPEKKNLSVLSLGVPRSQVIAELGPPVHQSNDEFGERDVFSFKQGYSLPVRVGRATVHAVGDLLTLGLWEVVSTPLESSLDGEGVQAEVRYDREQYVRRVEFFSGAHLAHGGPTLAPWMRSASTQQTGVLESTIPDPEASYYEEVVSESPGDS